MWRRVFAALWLLPLLALSGCALAGTRGETETASADSTRAVSRSPHAHRPAQVGARAAHAPASAPAAPRSPHDCYAALWHSGVTFDLVSPDAAPGVQSPVRLRSRIGGVAVASRGHNPQNEIIDCRLALRLLAWAPKLRSAGVSGIEHYSIYRPGARTPGHHTSAHAHALAIDAARFHLVSGAVVDVLSDWEDRDRGAEPCLERREEAWPSRLLRGVVCDAIREGIFQVVLTPHHDAAHDNHVHLEVRPNVNWTYVR